MKPMTSDRIREIQETTAYPESVSVKEALLQVWNECEQYYKYRKTQECHCGGYPECICDLPPSEEKKEDCESFDECQGRNECTNAKVKSNKCIGVDCGEFKSNKEKV